MTRPRHALHMVLEPLKPTKSKGASTAGRSNMSHAAILRHALTNGDETFEGNEVLFQCGDPDWFEAVETAAPMAVHTAPSPCRIRLATSDGRARRTWPRRSPSQLEHGALVDARQLLRVEPEPSRLRGTLIQAWFELIEWIDTTPLPDDQQLRAAAARLARVS